MFGIISSLKEISQFVAQIATIGNKDLTLEEKEQQSKEIMDRYSLFSTQGSLGKLIGSTIIQPTIYVSNDLKGNENSLNAIHATLDIFASFLVVAFKHLVELNGVEARTALMLLNTSSGKSKLILKGYGILANAVTSVQQNVKLESWSGNFVDSTNYSLDSITSILRTENKKIDLTFRDVLESIRREDSAELEIETKPIEKEVTGKGKTTSSNTFNLKDLDKGIGYEFLTRNFEFEAHISGGYIDKGKSGEQELGGVTLKIPIQLKANIVYVTKEDLQAGLFDKTGEHNFLRRFERWRAGGISFKELIFATDLIKEYRQAKINDKAGMLNKIDTMDTASLTKYVVSGKTFGYNRYYNLFVLTEAEAESIGRLVNGNLSTNNKAKELFLEKLNGLMVTTIDQKWELINLGIKDMEGFSTASFKDLARRRKGSKESLNEDILKLLMTNKLPTF